MLEVEVCELWHLRVPSLPLPSLQWMNSVRPDAAVVWADLTKLGRLKSDDVNEICDLIRSILSHSPGIMVGVLIVPVLASSKVASGLRGEIRLLGYSWYSPLGLQTPLQLRRLEDKLDAKFLDNVCVNIRMAEPHNNKKHALLYPALICWPAGVQDNLFQSSRLVVDRLGMGDLV